METFEQFLEDEIGEEVEDADIDPEDAVPTATAQQVPAVDPRLKQAVKAALLEEVQEAQTMQQLVEQLDVMSRSKIYGRPLSQEEKEAAGTILSNLPPDKRAEVVKNAADARQVLVLATALVQANKAAAPVEDTQASDKGGAGDALPPAEAPPPSTIPEAKEPPPDISKEDAEAFRIAREFSPDITWEEFKRLQ